MKRELRQSLRGRRRAFAPRDAARRSKLAAAAVARLPQFKSGSRVAVYLPFDGEMDTAPILAAAESRRVQVYVPVVADRRHGRIQFFPLSGGTRRGTFGIRVPARSGRPIPPRWLDLIVVPLVGIDALGRRLGFGGGFYDRALAFRRSRRNWPGPLLVGYCFECQRVESVFAQSWDARMDALATEAGLSLFRREVLR